MASTPPSDKFIKPLSNIGDEDFNNKELVAAKFYIVNSPIKFYLIPPSLYIDYVNTLLKLYNYKKEGVFTINKKRALKHTKRLKEERAAQEKLELETSLTIKALEVEDRHATTRTTLANIKRSNPYRDINPNLIKLKAPPNIGLSKINPNLKGPSSFLEGLLIRASKDYIDELLDFNKIYFTCKTLGGHNTRSKAPIALGGKLAAKITRKLREASLKH
ncbi:hypothetical protein J1614_004969, partial [Plenodomus biglobosus]